MGRMHNTRVDTGARMYMCLHTCTHAHIYKCVCVCVYLMLWLTNVCVLMLEHMPAATEVFCRK